MSRDDLDARKPASSRRKRAKRPVESLDLAAAILRLIRALRLRAEGGDLAALAALAELEKAAGDDMAAAIAALLSDEWFYTWQQIAEALGVSRQAAMQRFRKARGVRSRGGQPGRRR